jgi:hypothetical protein
MIKAANTNTNDLLDSDDLQARADDREWNVLASELEALALRGPLEKRGSALQSMVDPMLLAVGKPEQVLGQKDPWDNCHIAKTVRRGEFHIRYIRTERSVATIHTRTRLYWPGYPLSG